MQRIATLAGRAPHFVQGDVRDRTVLDRLLKELPITGVLHFAGLKAVGESVQNPLRYFDDNVGSTLVLCQAMAAAALQPLRHGLRPVFSANQRKLPDRGAH